ncbi:MAG: hypothetical protein ACM3NQ_24765 [Bacteroidales bacterium]
MSVPIFRLHDGLAAAARLPRISTVSDRVSIAELALLFLCGIVAATAQAYVRLRLGIPGHAIVLSVVPMALGLALAPRRMAGSVMSAGAFTTAACLTAFAGARYGGGAFTSLCLIGPMMDVALAGARRGWRLYLALVLAGIGANFCALVSRTGGKLFGFDLPGARPFGSWWAQALLTYTLSGAVAGLLGALCWFQFRAGRNRADTVSHAEHAR